MNSILIAVIVLGSIGLIAAIVLFVCSKKFAVFEDPRIAQVNELLPGANCGGCGFAGCRNFAEACVKAGSTDGLACPVGGDPTMDEVKKILSPAADEAADVSGQPADGEKKGFDPTIAAKIKALATPRAVFPLALGRR